MNIKFNELSVIGKTWAVAEMFYYGLRDNNQINIDATYTKLKEMANNEEIMKSVAVKKHSFRCMIESVDKILAANNGGPTEDLIFDGSIAAKVWFDAINFYNIKNNAKANLLTTKDYEYLKQILREIKHIWGIDLKEKKLSSKERRDLFKIKEEVSTVINNLDNKIRFGELAIG